jgi:lipopolysaccharide export system protein LptC
MFLLNTAPNLIIWQITGSRAAVLILTFAIGCVTGWLVGIQQKKSGGKIIAESASSN